MGQFLPGFSAGDVVGWLWMAWVHFTLSAQLRPVWERRAAASVDEGPLAKNTQKQSAVHDCGAFPANRQKFKSY